MRRWRNLLIALLGMAMARSGAAQSVSVAGRLTDRTSGAPISGATVELSGIDRQSITTADGRFRLSDVAAGRYFLRILHVAYGSQGDSLTVAGTDLSLAIRLSPRAIELQPISVDAPARERSETSKSYVVTRQQIDAVKGTARHLGDVARAYIPGATLSESVAGYVCLEFRGARGSRTRGCNYPLVIVDNVPIPAPAQYLRDTPPDEIERIEFVPASAGAGRYGLDSQYGALVIRTRRSGMTGAAAPVPAQPGTPPRSAFPAYQWSQEQRTHPWPRAMIAATLGNTAGTAAGLMMLGCFQGATDSASCLSNQSVATSMAVLALPVLGAALGARTFGETSQSKGRLLHSAVAAALPLVLGYAMVRDGEIADFNSSRLIGGTLVLVGAPMAATVADGLFRRRRDPH